MSGRALRPTSVQPNPWSDSKEEWASPRRGDVASARRQSTSRTVQGSGRTKRSRGCEDGGGAGPTRLIPMSPIAEMCSVPRQIDRPQASDLRTRRGRFYGAAAGSAAETGRHAGRVPP